MYEHTYIYIYFTFLIDLYKYTNFYCKFVETILRYIYVCVYMMHAFCKIIFFPQKDIVKFCRPAFYEKSRLSVKRKKLKIYKTSATYICWHHE